MYREIEKLNSVSSINLETTWDHIQMIYLYNEGGTISML